MRIWACLLLAGCAATDEPPTLMLPLCMVACEIRTSDGSTTVLIPKGPH